MKKLWLSYSWKDNVDEDVDFIAQEIRSEHFEVYQDRFVLVAGQRLWPQIERAIIDPDASDGWAIFLTLNSLNSEPVREEMAYALHRALGARGSGFPIIGISSGAVATEDLPSLISTRLFVDLRDRDWVERVRSSLTGLSPNIARNSILPVHVTWHNYDGKLVLEARPRAGRWFPAYFSTPEIEAHKVVQFGPGPSGGPTGFTSTTSSDWVNDKVHTWKISNNITPIESLYVYFLQKPTWVEFGNREDMYRFVPPSG